MPAPTCPLDMHQVIFLDRQICWEEVILGSWKRLHDITSLSSNIKIMDDLSTHTSLSLVQNEDMRTILKGFEVVFGFHCKL